MFVKTDPQRSLLECEFLLPPEKRQRLKKSWAEPDIVLGFSSRPCCTHSA